MNPTRRQVLQVGAIGLMNLTLPRLLRAEQRRLETGQNASADSCILIFLNGGPSHLDMWDMKPAAPAEIRGEFRPIDTSLPGLQFSEHMPLLARQAHRCTVIRSAHHGVNNSHAAAVYCGLTGHDRGELGGGARPTDNPAIGSVVGMLRPPGAPVVPYVSLPYITAEGAGGPPQPGFYGGWLGRSHDPFFVLKDPNASDFAMPELTLPGKVPPRRFAGRRRLIESLGVRPDALESNRKMRDLDTFQAQACDLLSAPAMRKAFRIDQEDPRTRDRYGRNIYGQSVLLSRRLIEAGTRVACISWAPDANATWDTHGNNFRTLKTTLLPQLDMAVSSLLDDLALRGMLGRTLVVVMGEFGRSPKINPAAGRDHWTNGFSVALAGGGIRPGFALGETDPEGVKPPPDHVTVAGIHATILTALGIDPKKTLQSPIGRTVQLSKGKAIKELLPS